ncbi:MAG: helix-turn-helix transcriptional regulator [Pseudomonadota bacterium]
MKLQERVTLFQERLGRVISASGLNRAQFAKSVGVDRSTLSQLLAPENVRLPRADTIAAIAERYQTSIDWLLGLSQEGALGTDIVPGPLELSNFNASSIHDTFLQWHRDASGYKVRYVPTTLPDLLKTEVVAGYEFTRYGSGKVDQSVRDNQLLLLQQRHPGSELEICQSLHVLSGFARGEGVWSGLPARDRVEQLERMIELYDELYPGFRWFLFDAKDAYSAPFTVYGPLRAVLFVGQLYVLINSIDHIRKLSDRFDHLIRIATVQPHEIRGTLEALIDEIA